MKKIYLNLAHLGGEEINYVQKAFDEDWVAPLGPNVNGFEEDLKQYLGGGKEVLALSSGTAAVHLGMVGCGVTKGDEVIVQSFTFCASANPALYLGAKPVFVDSERETWNIDPELLEEAIEDRMAKTGRKPKAIVPVSLYGMPFQADRIMEIADRYGIPVLEDSAEGLGSTYHGRQLCTFGKFGVLSFNGNKIITTSAGGALICPDRETKERMLYFSTQAREPYPFYQHDELGYNYHMSNVCAGIGRGQMAVLQDHLDRHRHIERMYEELLGAIPGISVHSAPSPEMQSNYWLSTLTLDPDLQVKGQEKCSVFAEEGIVAPNRNVLAVKALLEKEGIESRPLWKPLHLQPLYDGAPYYGHHESLCEDLFRKGLCLPGGPRVSDSDIRFICHCINEAIVH